MKKHIKKVVCIILVIIFILTIKIKGQSDTEIETYKNRTINIFGIEITYGDKEYFSGENHTISSEEKEKNNNIVGVFSGFLVIYWLVLLFVFEKEDIVDYTYENADDIQTLKKYNPLIAGCLVDNREVLARDVTAVILNLVQKQAINMKIVPKIESKETYKYIISENKSWQGTLDETERYVLNWVFGFYEQDEIELVEKLKEISSRKDFLKKLKELNEIAQLKLNKIGANIKKVPSLIRKANIFLIFISIIMSVIHITNNGLDIHIYETTILLAIIVLIGVIIILPVIGLGMHIILLLIAIIKRAIKLQILKHSGKEIVTTSILILVSVFILIGLLYIIVPNKYICLDIFMIGMSILIIKTDNLMTKHNPEIMRDYCALQEIKYRISEYSLINEKGINYIKIWKEYLVYAIAFGIPVEIVNKLRDTTKEDEDIKYLLEAESLYYICKAYLEVMWDMDFKEQKNKSKVSSIFKTLF